MVFQYTNEDDEDDWDISSLDDLSVPAPVGKPTAPLRKSLESDSATSVWGTSTGKGQKTGQSHSLSLTDLAPFRSLYPSPSASDDVYPFPRFE